MRFCIAIFLCFSECIGSVFWETGKAYRVVLEEKTTPFIFSADETADVGVDEATPVTEAYAEYDNGFNGTIAKVTVDLN